MKAMKALTTTRALSITAIVLVLVMCFSAAASAASEETPALDGTYTRGSVLGQTVLIFDADGSVTVKYLAGGVEIYSQDAAYEIDGDETEITLIFADADGNVTHEQSFYFDRAQHGVILDDNYYTMFIEDEAEAAA